MISKHFNVSFLDIKYLIEPCEFWPMLASALDLEELNSYYEFIRSGGKKEKFPWVSDDHAGLKPRQDPSDMVSWMDDLARKQKRPVGQHTKARGSSRGTVERIAAAQGRQVAYIHPDGRTTDVNGKVIQRTPDMFPYALSQQEAETFGD